MLQTFIFHNSSLDGQEACTKTAYAVDELLQNLGRDQIISTQTNITPVSFDGYVTICCTMTIIVDINDVDEGAQQKWLADARKDRKVEQQIEQAKEMLAAALEGTPWSLTGYGGERGYELYVGKESIWEHVAPANVLFCVKEYLYKVGRYDASEQEIQAFKANLVGN